MFENPRTGKQARNFTTNVPKILDLKSSSEQIFSENCVGFLCPITHSLFLKGIFNIVSDVVVHLFQSGYFRQLLQVGTNSGRHKLRKTKETKDRKQNNSK